MAELKKILVGAIDFGTTYSGWAFSFRHEYESDPTKASIKQWHSGSGTLATEKTPTVILIDPDGKTLSAFGYDAENKFKDLTDKGGYEEYYYFRRFKMTLLKKLGEKLDRHMTLEDEMGRSLFAIDVFSLSIQYLMEDMMKVVNVRLSGNVTQTDIRWVITVPAIWTDGAKQFMREAAVQAGIDTDMLIIALEPEAASLFCRHLSVESTVDQKSLSVSQFSAGVRYLVLDAGGGTIDTTIHEVGAHGTIKEIHAATGGGWGGIMVDKEFENLLIDIFGEDTYSNFKRTETEDWLDLWRDFEVKKRSVEPKKESRINMKLPLSLINMYEEKNGSKLSIAIGSSKYADSISFSGDKMKFIPVVFEGLFDKSIKCTIDLVTSLIDETKVKTILMVGGYSESQMLQEAVMSAFPEHDVIIPLGASSTILRGALVYGHNPRSISERILRYTYGVETTYKFEEGKHLESKRKMSDIGDRCYDIFDKHVEKNQVVCVGEAQTRRNYSPISRDQTQAVIPIFASELMNPVYTDEASCIHLGDVTVEIPSSVADATSRTFWVSLTFSGTEILVDAEDEISGSKVKVSVNYLG